MEGWNKVTERYFSSDLGDVKYVGDQWFGYDFTGREICVTSTPEEAMQRVGAVPNFTQDIRILNSPKVIRARIKEDAARLANKVKDALVKSSQDVRTDRLVTYIEDKNRHRRANQVYQKRY